MAKLSELEIRVPSLMATTVHSDVGLGIMYLETEKVDFVSVASPEFCSRGGHGRVAHGFQSSW